MKRRIATRLAAVGIAFVCVGPHPQAASAADDDPLIWAPAKTGINAYRLRLGVRFPWRWNTTAGAEFSMGAAQSGKITPPAAPVRLWGALSHKSGRAATRSSQVSLDFNALSGAGNVGAATARTWMVTPAVDAEVHRSIALQCNAYENRCVKPRLTQTARLTSPATRTSVVAQGELSADGINSVSRIGFEQKFGNLQLGAAVVDPLLAPRSVFDIRYSLRW
ncbi:hypothetical protein [Sinorhizobium mexicanum]|uniref:Uncharacterized protein n=1 Tax=Sinorhizobium mexicanum TaxID=375549 RepID=A0A859QHN2_9HYPH|nr:hypothetical protein [Sinorhizobium mexicanum]MBP1882585.1 hypothetical protein [Sinorhizobium mexicanum]QLL61250.1 hypothetical protein FKV68_07205 [Sinorhizobium mexicanum]